MPAAQVEFNEKWYKKFISATDEKNILVDKISNLIDGRDFKTCLEIGLGTRPYFAHKMAGKFNRYLIVEKREYTGYIPENTELINADWEDTPLDEKFDVIIASHVIYYFRNKKKAFEKVIAALNPGGIALFVVNGKTADYGPVKLTFAAMIKTDYKFTYDMLIALVKNHNYREYTLSSTIHYKNYEDLFETLKLSFDTYPEEYEKSKLHIIEYLKSNIKRNNFIIDQKIIEVVKE